VVLVEADKNRNLLKIRPLTKKMGTIVSATSHSIEIDDITYATNFDVTDPTSLSGKICICYLS